MNNIRQVQELNKRELEAGIGPNASWHADYRDTAYIYIGGLPYNYSEGDIITIFSQFGEPTYINLIRDKETGKSKGFAFLKYEDQRSCDLAVDNLGGASVDGRMLRVDHTRYKKKAGEKEEGIDLTIPEKQEDEEDEGRRRRRSGESESEEERPMIQEEIELAKLLKEHDDEDPMKEYLVKEKRDEVAVALARSKDGKQSRRGDQLRKHRHHHRSRRIKEERDDREDEKFPHHKRREETKRPRSRDRSPRRARSPKRDSRDRGEQERERERPRREESYDDRRHRSRLES